jgi:ABC-2 type transport system permease protein
MTHTQIRFGEPRIHLVNWQGVWTLYYKEVRRFLKVFTQTVAAPAVTTLLFLAIFQVALGRGGKMVMGVSFADFLAPGLIVMAMVQNAFANTSSSILIGKIQGAIIDVLMPPLSAAELTFAFLAGAVTRAALVGLAVWLALLVWPGVHVRPHHLGAILLFGLLGSLLMGLLGIITGMWADKFDHAAAITNFIIQPLTLLSGTFYTMDRLPGVWSDIGHWNPFFFIIDGFRYGFIGQADGSLMVGALVLGLINVVLLLVCYVLLKRGWRLRT